VTTFSTTPPRLPLVETPEDPALREEFDKLASGSGILNLHRMMAHAPALMKASGDMALAFRRDTELPRSLAELAILRAAQVIASDYVFTRHLPLALENGVTERQLAELGHWTDSAAFTPAQKAALGFVENIAQRRPVDDGAFAELRRDFSPREIVELTMLVGFYVSTAIVIGALAVPDENS
jgi:alkylhydroperoxidase family enzyme